MDLESRIKNISPEESLMLINSTDIDTEGKCWAIKRITNPEILRNLLKHTDDPIILKTIIEDTVLLSKENLMDFAFNCKNWKIRLIAVNTWVQDSEFSNVCREIFDSNQYDNVAFDDVVGVALNDENKYNRLVAALLIDDESVLETIALNDAENHVRIAAISGIVSQDKLVNIIKKNHDRAVLYLASLKITDESKIIDLIRTKDNTNVVYVVSQRLDEDRLMELFPTVRVRAQRGIIKNIHNQLFLIDTVYKEDDGGICLYACHNIYSQKVLHDIVIDEKLRCKIETFDRFISFPDDYFYYDEFLYLTLSLIVDDDLFSDIVFNHPEFKYEFSAAFYILNHSLLADVFLRFPLNLRDISPKVQITDTEKLFKMALNHPVIETRIAAAEMIFDKDKLERIIENDSTGEVKPYALRNLNIDESEFSLDADDTLIFIEALKKIRDDAQLLEIFGKYKNYNIKQAACENIGDEQILKDIACTNHLRIASQAINNIASESILAEIALNASFEKVGVYAITKITDNNLLENIFENSSSYCCQINALSRITDENFLEDVSSNNPDEYLKSIAQSR